VVAFFWTARNQEDGLTALLSRLYLFALYGGCSVLLGLGLLTLAS
jgi:hypothetical protein